MRVVGGFYRSRTLLAPDGLNTRPTMDKVKESMFNIIGPKVIDSVCLDLFSGSGSLGIEAISRGAKKVYFNDHNINSFNCIKKNLDALKVESEKYELTMLDYNKCIEKLDSKIDIVFLDPPYKEKIYEDIINALKDRDLLSDYPVIVCEADLNLEQFELDSFKCKEYVYGNKKLLIYKGI